jgi:hypothetical protein
MTDDLRIEYPSAGATYSRDEYGVYAYGVYPKSSVLAGMTKRTFLDAYDTLAEAIIAYPDATVVKGSSFVDVNLDHLPGDDDIDYGDVDLSF